LIKKRRKFCDFHLEIAIEKDLRFTVYSFNVVKQDDGYFEKIRTHIQSGIYRVCPSIFETLLHQIAGGSYEPPTRNDADKFVANEKVHCPTQFGVQAGFTYSKSSH
jgi:hypothetical protein